MKIDNPRESRTSSKGFEELELLIFYYLIKLFLNSILIKKIII